MCEWLTSQQIPSIPPRKWIRSKRNGTKPTLQLQQRQQSFPTQNNTQTKNKTDNNQRKNQDDDDDDDDDNDGNNNNTPGNRIAGNKPKKSRPNVSVTHLVTFPPHFQCSNSTSCTVTSTRFDFVVPVWFDSSNYDCGVHCSRWLPSSFWTWIRIWSHSIWHLSSIDYIILSTTTGICLFSNLQLDNEVEELCHLSHASSLRSAAPADSPNLINHRSIGLNHRQTRIEIPADTIWTLRPK